MCDFSWLKTPILQLQTARCAFDARPYYLEEMYFWNILNLANRFLLALICFHFSFSHMMASMSLTVSENLMHGS